MIGTRCPKILSLSQPIDAQMLLWSRAPEMECRIEEFRPHSLGLVCCFVSRMTGQFSESPGSLSSFGSTYPPTRKSASYTCQGLES